MDPVADCLDSAEPAIHETKLFESKSREQVRLAIPTRVQVRQDFGGKLGIVDFGQVGCCGELLVKVNRGAILNRKLADVGADAVQAVALGSNIAFGVERVGFDRKLLTDNRLQRCSRGGDLK